MKFMKVKSGELFTPVLEYRLGDFSVKAIGTIHIGDDEYYQNLQGIINRIENGLYEGIQRPKEDCSLSPEQRRSVETLKNLGNIYTIYAKYLNLSYQKLNYGWKWECPDLSADELVQALPEELLKLLVTLEDNLDWFEVAYRHNPKRLAKGLRMLYLLEYKYPFLMDFFSSQPELMEKHLGRKRNESLFLAMEKKFGESKELGVVYGFAHLDGLNQYLGGNSFKLERIVWQKAWKKL